MESHPSQDILTEMTDIVINHINERGMALRENSFFAREIEQIKVLERRELLRNYVCDGTLTLLSGIIDQVRSMDQVLARPGVSVSPFILGRAALEYSYKIAYLADPPIDPEERICRALRLYYVDIEEYRKLPGDLKPSDSDQQVAELKQLAEKWYFEVTGKQLSKANAREIFDAAAQSEDEYGDTPWDNQAVGNSSYEKGYRIGSALTHGSIWAINHYCLTTALVGNRSVISPGLNEASVDDMRLIAAGCLMYSFGLTAQLLSGILPSGTMNQLEQKIWMIRMGHASG